MKVRILHEEVKHNGHILEQYEIYDLPDNNAAQLIEVGVAEEAGEKKDARPEPEPLTPVKEPIDHYVAEAKIDKDRLSPEQQKQVEEIDAEGKPVIPPAAEKDPAEEVVVSNAPEGTTTAAPQDASTPGENAPANPDGTYGKPQE